MARLHRHTNTCLSNISTTQDDRVKKMFNLDLKVFTE